MRSRYLLASALLALALAGPASARGTLDSILPEIRAQHPGRLSDAEPWTDAAGRTHYRIKWMTPEGRILYFNADADSGRFTNSGGDGGNRHGNGGRRDDDEDDGGGRRTHWNNDGDSGGGGDWRRRHHDSGQGEWRDRERGQGDWRDRHGGDGNGGGRWRGGGNGGDNGGGRHHRGNGN